MTFDPAAEGWRHAESEGIETLLGPFWTKNTDAGRQLAFLCDDKHRNRAGIIHGGMLMHALGMMAWEAGGRQPCVTLQLDTHFVSAAQVGDFVEASGTVIRCTRSVVFMRGALRVGEREVLSASGIWKRLAAP